MRRKGKSRCVVRDIHTHAPLAYCICAVFFTVCGHNPAQPCPCLTFWVSSVGYMIRFYSKSWAVITLWRSELVCTFSRYRSVNSRTYFSRRTTSQLHKAPFLWTWLVGVTRLSPLLLLCLGGRKVEVWVPLREKFLSSPRRPYWFRDPPSLLSNEYRGLFPWGWSGRYVKLTTHLQLVSSQEYMDLYIHSPICLHGLLFNRLSTGTTYLFLLWNYSLV
jgi:hypothetical protein